MFFVFIVGLICLLSLIAFFITGVIFIIDIFRKKKLIKYAIIFPSIFILFMASGFTAASMSNNLEKDKDTASSGKTSSYSSSESSSSEEATYSSSSDSSSSSSTTDADKDPNSYKTGITYEQIARTPDQFKGQKLSFTGKVVQVTEDGDAELRVAVDGNSDNIIYVFVDKDLIKKSRVLEDDLITVSGKSKGTISYDSTGSGKITIPAINAKIINDQGKASDDYGE